jgi:PPOX class probable F420-dependent enzyme
MTLEGKALELFEGPNFAHLATVNPDGSPQVSPVWVHVRDGLIEVNTSRGRMKDRNMSKESRVALSITDASDPYVRASVQGEVVEQTEEGAVEHIDFLSEKYNGVTPYPNLTPGMVRVIYRIRPRKVHVTGG